MKKLFTLIAAAVVSLSVSAQTFVIKDAYAKGGQIPSETKLLDNEFVTATSNFDANASVIKDDSDAAAPQTIGDFTFANFSQIRTLNNVSASNPTGDDNGNSMALLVTVKKDTKFTVYYRRQAASNAFAAADGKDLKCFNRTTGATAGAGELVVDHKTSDDAYGYCSQTWNLAAGDYTFWAKGTTIQFYGFNTEAGAAASDPTPGPAAGNEVYANEAAAALDGFSTMVYADGAKVVLVGNADKSYANGNSLSYNGDNLTSTKVSNGAQNKFIAPAGKFVTSVDIISYVNKDAKTDRPCFWKEVNGVNYSLDGAEGTVTTTEMTSYKATETPDVYTFELGGVSEFTFTNTGEQACFVLKVTYGEQGTGVAEVAAAPAAVKVIKTPDFIIKNGVKYNYAGQIIK